MDHLVAPSRRHFVERRVARLITVLMISSVATAPPTSGQVLTGHGTVLTVGPGQQYGRPSQAAEEARAGDTVRIFPGSYVDCALWRQDNLAIEGVGDGVVIGNRSCAGQGVFVITGNNVTVTNLTLTGAKVPDHNGAGIRSQGGDLTVDKVKFISNENGILATAVQGGTVIVRRSLFRGNGGCVTQCAHGIYVSQPGLLLVEQSEFVDQRSGHHIKSRASVTEVIGNFIHDGSEGTASYLVDIPQGGVVTIVGNHFEKGPHAENTSTAIAIGAELGMPQYQTARIVIENNNFTNDMSARTVFVHNYSNAPAILRFNQFHGAVTPLEGPGTVDHPSP